MLASRAKMQKKERVERKLRQGEHLQTSQEESRGSSTRDLRVHGAVAWWPGSSNGEHHLTLPVIVDGPQQAK